MNETARKRILVVDDDVPVTDLLTQILAEYEVSVVPDAESALEAARAVRPDLFILDLVLPGMRGTALAGLLRETPEFARTPMFLVSGLIVRDQEQPDSPVRVDELTAFTKPFDFMIFRQHVKMHLAGAEEAAAALEALPAGKIAWD
jgi:DNA-binding response OmpR family regulator